ncbi:MAG: glucose 1-dehydrogenase [Alphaproteobacteria bacterium]
MAGRVEGKIAFVTGGGSGMGREHSLLLAEQGATIVVSDVNEAGGRQTVADINSKGGQGLFIKFDVAKEAEWKSAVDQAMSTFGRVDILVNNAGILIMKNTQDTTGEELDRMLDINVKGVFFGCKHILPAMQKAGGGSIVNISSIAGIIGMKGAAAYQAAKGAVRILTKSVAVEYAPFNIRANSIHPGVIRTPMTQDFLVNEKGERAFLGTTLLRRPAEPREVSYPVLFLASSESSYITGAEIVVDGGYTTM